MGTEKKTSYKKKEDKKVLKKSPTFMDVLYLIMLHINGNVDKKFQASILYRSREKHQKANNKK